VYFTKIAVGQWIGLRMSLIGYTLTIFNRLYPILQFYGLLHAQSAALVGFSITYSSEVVGIISQFIMNYSDLEMQLVSIERLREYAAPLSESEAAGAALLSEVKPLLPFQTGAETGLRLVNVEVTYRSGLQPALKGVSLHFPVREAAAIVGRTGAGKTSLLLSILQLVPYSGTIQVGSEDLMLLSPEEARRRIVGVVPQTPVIFSGDIRYNLDPDGQATDDQMREALAAVGLQSLWKEFEQKVKDEEADDQEAHKPALSQGQMQLLCAARVLLRRPKVAMLDEVTASLPPETTISTVTALIGRFKEVNAVVLLVTHQEEILQCCDRIVTVSAGRIFKDQRLVA